MIRNADVDERRIDAAQRLDAALRDNPAAVVLDEELPLHVAASLRFLHGLFGSTFRSTETDTESLAPLRISVKPDSLGRFVVHERLGAGSYGVVFRGFDTVLKRTVALKLPRLLTTLSDKLLQRFLREGEAAGRLHHPHIVPVFEVGTAGSSVYIAAEYSAGSTLDEWLRKCGEGVDPPAAARLVLDLSDAVQHAHESGVLHRDLKPANILLTETANAESPSEDGVLKSAKITDFGLARFLHEENSTATGELVGTIAYMSPEQARGGGESIGPGCDIYALGVILYESLTLKRPLEGTNHVETLRRICDRSPVPPRRLRPEIPCDLEAICLKCLRKKPADRYASAAALRDDLQRFLTGEATIARPLTLPEQIVRSARRHPGRAALLAVAAVLAVAGGFAVNYHFEQLKESVDVAEANREIAESRQTEVTDLLYVADMRLALVAYHQGDPATVRAQLAKYRDRPGVRGIEWDFLKRRLQQSRAVVNAHHGPIYSSAVSSDGRLLATVGKDRVVRLWDVRTHKLHAELKGHTNEINEVAFNKNGSRLATGSDDGTVRLWNLKTLAIERVLNPMDGVVFSVAFSPDGRWLASGGKGRTLHLWTAAGEPVARWNSFDHVIDHLIFAPDSRLLAVATGRKVELWDVVARRKVSEFRIDDGYITKVAFSPRGNLLAAVNSGSRLFVWRTKDRTLLADARGHRGDIHDVKFVLDGGALATASNDGTVRVWKIAKGFDEPASNSKDSPHPARRSGRKVLTGDVTTIDGQCGRIWSVSLLDGGRTLVASGHDGSIRYWPNADADRNPVFGSRSQSVKSVDFAPDGRMLYTTDGRTISAWDAVRNRWNRNYAPLRSQIVSGISVSADGRKLAVGLGNASVAVLAADEKSPVKILRSDGAIVRHVRFSPKTADLLATADDNGTLWVWNTKTWSVIRRIESSIPNRMCITFSKDGTQLACHNGRELILRETATWNAIQRIPGHHPDAQSVAFSPDNRRVVATYSNGSSEIHDTSSGRLLFEMKGHLAAVSAAVFSHNERTLFTSAYDGTIRVWRAKTGQEIGVLTRLTGPIDCLRLSKDGTTLAAGFQCDPDGCNNGLLIWKSR